MLIGQNELKAKIDNLIGISFPQVVTILSKPGYGKTSVINYICDKLNIKDIVVLNKIDEIKNSYRYVNESAHKVALVVSCYEALNFRAKETLLKLCEDINDNTFVFIEVSNISLFDDRFINRSLLLELKPYSKDDLINIIKSMKQDIDDENINKILSIFGSPKEFEKLLSMGDINTFSNFIDKVIENVTSASPYNSMKILNSLSTKLDDNKVDFNLFFKALSNLSFRKYYKTKDTKYYKIFKNSNDVIDSLNLCRTLNKTMLFDNFIFSLSECK